MQSDAHTHAHAHSHAPANFGRAFCVGILLNFAFVIVEVFYGYASHSLALVADAGHNLSDVFGLAVAWIATILVQRKPSRKFTYGLRSSSILAALLNAIVLLLVVGGIIWEAIHRFAHPEPVVAKTMMVVAAIGIAINSVTAWLFMSGRKSDLNIKAAFLHMAGDALVSAGVVIAGFIILNTGARWIDPLMSLGISIVIIATTWNLLRESLGLALHAVPDSIDANAVKVFLQNCEGVTEVHDLHIWPMSTTDTALTAHLLIPRGHPGDGFLHATTQGLLCRFKINHSTLQIEVGDTSQACSLESDEVV